MEYLMTEPHSMFAKHTGKAVCIDAREALNSSTYDAKRRACGANGGRTGAVLGADAHSYVRETRGLLSGHAAPETSIWRPQA